LSTFQCFKKIILKDKNIKSDSVLNKLKNNLKLYYSEDYIIVDSSEKLIIEGIYRQGLERAIVKADVEISIKDGVLSCSASGNTSFGWICWRSYYYR